MTATVRRLQPLTHAAKGTKAVLPLHWYLQIDPAWLETDNIDRREGLSVEEFREQYERPNRPVLLTDVVGGRASGRRVLAAALGWVGLCSHVCGAL